MLVHTINGTSTSTNTSKGYSTSGAFKHTSLHTLNDPAEWLDEETQVNATALSPTQAYTLVPYLYRSIDIRAKALSSIPWSLQPESSPGSAPSPAITADDDALPSRVWGIERGMRQRLYLTEVALCLYGAAYWMRETDTQATNQLSLRWLAPASIAPRYHPYNGIVGYERHIGSSRVTLAPQHVVAFWLPGVTHELGPGTPPAQVALAAARVLYNLDLFAEGFFRRGAIKATLLTVDGNPPPQEMKRLELWWNRLLAGVSNAWRSIAIRSSVKPIIIGDGLADTQNRELTIQQREHVCAALGVPHSLLSADAASYATSLNDKLTFLNQTVLPSARLIEEAINDQLCAAEGLRFSFHPERIEELQQYEVQKAQSLVPLVQAGILTRDEARTMLYS